MPKVEVLGCERRVGYEMQAKKDEKGLESPLQRPFDPRNPVRYRVGDLLSMARDLGDGLLMALATVPGLSATLRLEVV